MKICDHTSVGIFVWEKDKLLLIERKKIPYGFAIPAGHVDGDGSFEEASARELKEETGLDSTKLELISESKKENPCRRENGNWHYWKLYKADVKGELNPSKDETKKIDYYSIDEIKILAEKTEKYLNREISEEEWEKNPGLEPVMMEWFKEIKII